MSTPSIAQLHRAIQIQEQIAKMEAELKSVLGGSGSTASTVKAPAATTGKKRRKMSAAGRANIIAAQKARWAEKKGTSTTSLTKAPAAKAPKKKGGLTPEGRSRLSAKMKARWAAKKKAEK